MFNWTSNVWSEKQHAEGVYVYSSLNYKYMQYVHDMLRVLTYRMLVIILYLRHKRGKAVTTGEASAERKSWSMNRNPRSSTTQREKKKNIEIN